MRKSLLKWFTLIEMIITMIIVGILSVVLIEAYITVSKIALRVEQQKNISEESLVLTQIFQSISDEATIDYEKYNENSISLEDSDWFVDVLYLTWVNRSWTSIYTTGNCLDLEWNFSLDTDITEVLHENSDCSLVLEQNGITTKLNTQWKVIISKMKFRVIPYNDDEWYFIEWGENVINDIHQPAFWAFVHLYSPLYQMVWINKIDLPLQLFFNLNV